MAKTCICQTAIWHFLLNTIYHICMYIVPQNFINCCLIVIDYQQKYLDPVNIPVTVDMYGGSSDINATYFPVSDFTLTVAFRVNPYKLR